MLNSAFALTHLFNSTLALTHTLFCSLDCCFGKLTSSSFYTERKNVSSLNQQAFCASIGSCYSSNNSAISSCNNPSSWTWSEVNHTTVGETFSCKKWTTEVETDCLQECKFLGFIIIRVYFLFVINNT